jgi:protein-L-isoaspartate(D-aspartate) O-methyltransferase
MKGSEERHSAARDRLVRDLVAEGIRDPAVLRAIGRVPRHELVPPPDRRDAYVDAPLPIGRGQTISQPYIVALMTELLRVGPGDRVLDVGTGSGYQAAILAEIGCEVFGIERIPELAERAELDLERLGYRIHLRVGDGYEGWPDQAPFDGIVVAAAPEDVPEALLQQLRPGGRLVVPVGAPYGAQRLELIERLDDGAFERQVVAAVRFVPLVPAGKDQGTP